MEKEYLVTLHKNCNHDEFWHHMEHDTTHEECGCVPDRTVDCCNRKPLSRRTTGYMLTETEAQHLLDDPRVMGVEVDAGFAVKDVYATQTGSFSRSTTVNANFVNWALRRCVVGGVESTVGNTHTYNLDGTGVDVVIQDNGVMRGHPEFEDANGVTRLNEIDWYAVTGVSGSMPSSHYGDVGSHGTHVASTVAGKTYGWAKNAQIYSVRFDQLPTGDEMDLIRVWHQQKTNGRPTIVNASWGYRWYYPGSLNQSGSFTEINYRGVNKGTVRSTSYGMINQTHNIAGYAVIDAALEDLTDAGVIYVKAAGNYYHKQELVGGADYNNFYRCSANWAGGIVPAGQPIYYHRPGSPHSDDTIVVGNVDETPTNLIENCASSSEKGPRVDIWAPGSYITAATNSTGYGSRNSVYPFNSNYKIARISGTSMASPQVCGVLACFLQINPTATAQDCKNWLSNFSQSVMNIGDGTGTDYTNYNSTQGGDNKFLYMPYNSASVLTIT